jgi:hypothetical protein
MSYYSLREFEEKFSDTWNYAIEIEKVNKSRIVTAPVKSGKRILVEIQASRSRRPCGRQNEKHILLTSLNRKEARK